MNIIEIQEFCSLSKIKWSQRCTERMQERDISIKDVKNCIAYGEIIEDYPDDFPTPSCLIFGYTINNKVMHVVVGKDERYIWIITAYYPSTDRFNSDLKTKREK